MKPRERERRRRAKHKWQKAKRRENKIADAEKRLLGGEVGLKEGWTEVVYSVQIPLGRVPGN